MNFSEWELGGEPNSLSLWTQNKAAQVPCSCSWFIRQHIALCFQCHHHPAVMAAGWAASRDAVIDAWICLLTMLAMMVEVNALLSMTAEHTSSHQPPSVLIQTP